MGAYCPEDRQLGLLSCFLRDGWILSWNEYSLYVLDCLNEPSHLATPTILPPTGSVETAQPIRTMAIIVEVGGREPPGGEREGPSAEGEKEEVEEAEEQLEVTGSCVPRRGGHVWTDEIMNGN
ncbi:Tectonin beta-propeller repeat-containing protein 2 [Liparis tanakae]|uniref:Tectonin beta-propeller repeat-containing protein 2 n=1 Tax=Liparis tanakae TaxID=230148 RepID=A0A4Z2E4L0_9TELE|nr:Tectonin beta-propeller repeat-containing protein 2 [Liparis tanakae]